MPFSEDTLTRLKADAAEITGRYPRARSALLPLLYLVQAEEGYVSDAGMAFCAEVLGITETEVRGVASFYTMYKHEPAAEYQIGVCINTTCAIMGGDQIYAELAEHISGGPGKSQPHGDPLDSFHQGDVNKPDGGGPGTGHHGDIKSADGKVAVERLECNAACDYAPVVMINWEFFDNQTPQSAKKLVDDLRAGQEVRPTRGPNRLCTWKQANRILAGFGDGQAAEGPSAGPASLVGLKLAKERGWRAPATESASAESTAPEKSREVSASERGTQPPQSRAAGRSAESTQGNDAAGGPVESSSSRPPRPEKESS
jgi:NADH-quinone oxidoreductase subunit E